MFIFISDAQLLCKVVNRLGNSICQKKLPCELHATCGNGGRNGGRHTDMCTNFHLQFFALRKRSRAIDANTSTDDSFNEITLRPATKRNSLHPSSVNVGSSDKAVQTVMHGVSGSVRRTILTLSIMINYGYCRLMHLHCLSTNAFRLFVD